MPERSRTRSKPPGPGIRAEARHAAVGRLAGLLAHELNNPLTVVQLRTDLLAEERTDGARIRQQVPLLVDAVARFARAVRAFQQLARPPERREAVGLAEVVSQAVAAAPGARLVPGRGGSPEVEGDRAALALALEQLLAAAGRAEVSVEGTAARARVRVAAPPGTFTPPLPADRALALGVAEVVAADHRGALRTADAPDASAVVLDLPRLRARRRSSVLVVGADPRVTEVLADWCARRGHACAVAGGAREAVARLAEASPGVILVDDQLPAGGGHDLVTWLVQERADLAARTVWMWSPAAGLAPPEAPLRSLPKPFSRRDLGRVVAAVLAG